MTKPIPIRLRAGVAGEAWRVVHTAVELPAGGFRTLCQTTFAARLIEVVDSGGRSSERPPLDVGEP